jgi:hypothetical protein
MYISKYKCYCTALQALYFLFIFFEKVFEIEIISLNKPYLKLNQEIIQTENKLLK